MPCLFPPAKRANNQKSSKMGFKHLLGFCLLIAGIGLALLLAIFLFDRHSVNHLFLLYLGGAALVSFFLGFFILSKSG